MTESVTNHGECHVERAVKPVDEDALNRSSAAVLSVSGLGCPNCAIRVRNGLLARAGVLRAIVSLEKRRAWVNFDAEKTSAEDLVDAVIQTGIESKHGYDAVVLNVFA